MKRKQPKNLDLPLDVRIRYNPKTKSVSVSDTETDEKLATKTNIDVFELFEASTALIKMVYLDYLEKAGLNPDTLEKNCAILAQLIKTYLNNHQNIIINFKHAQEKGNVFEYDFSDIRLYKVQNVLADELISKYMLSNVEVITDLLDNAKTFSEAYPKTIATSYKASLKNPLDYKDVEVFLFDALQGFHRKKEGEYARKCVDYAKENGRRCIYMNDPRDGILEKEFKKFSDSRIDIWINEKGALEYEYKKNI